MASYSRDIRALGHEYNSLQSILVDGGTHFGVSTIAFDNLEELLWMGNQGGHVTSYTSPDLQKYTSFQVHVNNDVREIVPHEVGVLSLTSNSLRMSARRGLQIFTHCSQEMFDMQCMVLTHSGTLLLGGHHKNLIEFDLNVTEEIRIAEVSGENCAILRNHPRLICSGDIGGNVTLHDPNTLKVEHVINCHTGMLSDFDVHGNQLVTCGFSSRHGELAVDRYLNIYDLRIMRSMTPIQLIFPPLLLRFIQAYSSRLCVVSQTGQFQMVDTNSTDQFSPFIHQVENGGADIMTFDTSSSCQAFAFGDAAGYLHLYGTSDQVQFNLFSRPTEFADTVTPLHLVDINDHLTPLSTIPMPACEENLLSQWPPELIEKVYRLADIVDPMIANSMKMVGSIGYAPNPGNRLRNQVPYQLTECWSKTKSSQNKSSNKKDNGSDIVPQRYLKQEIKYIRADEIDFGRFNRTSFSGLEANLPNSYCNNMIQVLYFVEPLRCALLSHLCQREFCLACELGFLFHMLDTAQNMPCQASNFLRAFRTSPEASAHGLVITDLYEAKKRGKLQNLVQNWTRFILQQLHSETVGVDGNGGSVEHMKFPESSNDSIMHQLFGAKMFTCNRCRCKTETCKDTITFSVRLLYPECQIPGESPRQYSFEEIVERSLSPRQQTNAWCDTCKRFTSMVQTKLPRTLPDILVLTCGDNKKDIDFWETQLQLLTESGETLMMKALPEVTMARKKNCRYGPLCKRLDCRYYHEPKNSASSSSFNTSGSWIPFQLKLVLNQTDVTVEKVSAENIKNGNEGESTDELEHAILELTAIVSVIVDNQDSNKDNIVSCIKVGPSYHARRNGTAITQWYLFNDFGIFPVTPEEVVYLNLDWKWPSVLYFSRTDLNFRHNTTVHNPFKEQVFQDDVSLTSGNGQFHVNFMPLSKDNYLHNGKLVAIDAEFVTLNQEEAEIRSDGTRSTVRPPHLGVARITCVRGEGQYEGLPFIDDYISTQEQVVDYLTKFSGIQPGDLDANISSKHLTTLKSTYQKLRCLIDSGITFLGHGLKNDFRVINLVVPPQQIVDTVYLFQLPNQRMVSLQFLAWHFLDLKIQAETHDSVEDAKAALQLYKKYLELEREGTIVEALKVLYETGKPLQWKVPGTEIS